MLVDQEKGFEPPTKGLIFIITILLLIRSSRNYVIKRYM